MGNEELRRVLGEHEHVADALEAIAESDPTAHEVYEDTLKRSALLAAGQRAREARKLKQQDVADMMGTTQSAVSDLESGRVDPKFRTLQRYARAIGLEVGWSSKTRALKPAASAAELFAVAPDTLLGPVLTQLVREREENARTIKSLTDSLEHLLPAQLTTNALYWLEQRGWARTTGQGAERIYSLSPDKAHLIGLSLFRNRVEGALVDMHGEVIDNIEIPIDDTSPAAVLAIAVQAVRSLVEVSDKVVIGVGVSAAGVVERVYGDIRIATDLHSDDSEWRNVSFEQDLQARLQEEVSRDLRVAVENDVNALCLWEYLRQGDYTVASILLSGVGVGAGIVADGRLIYGAHSAAGEIGHVVVDPDGPECRLGLPHRGCLETVASAEGILRRLGITFDGTDQLGAGLRDANEMLAKGNREAERAFFEAGRAFGESLWRTVLLLDPGRVVVFAHSEFSRPSEYLSAKHFQAGVEAIMEAKVGERFDFVLPPKIEWKEIDSNHARAVAAAETAFWHFLSRPTHWAPSMRLTAASVAQQA